MTRKKFIAWLATVPLASGLIAACSEGDIPASLKLNEQPTSPMAMAQATSQPVAAAKISSLPKIAVAPDFTNETWINSPPLTLNALKGKVVLVEFWTFGCYNCQNVLPSLKGWYSEFKNEGFEIVAFHDPEFDYEKKLENVQEAVKKAAITYPVAIDNDFATWKKYRTNAWPTLHLVDKQGNLRYAHIGEGAYTETRAAIQSLLAE